MADDVRTFLTPMNNAPCMKRLKRKKKTPCAKHSADLADRESGDVVRYSSSVQDRTRHPYITLHALRWHCSMYPSSTSVAIACPPCRLTPLTVIFCSPSACHQRSTWISPPFSASELMVHLPPETSTFELVGGK